MGGSLPVVWLMGRRLTAQGLSDFTTSGGVPTCNGTRQPTPAVGASFYKANAPERRSLREAGVSGPPLRVSGTVIGLKCGVIRDAQVELWQADATGQYQHDRVQTRAAQRTDAKGAFTFDTVVPGAPAGRARRLHLRVTPPGHAALSTELFFPDDPRGSRIPRSAGPGDETRSSATPCRDDVRRRLRPVTASRTGRPRAVLFDLDDTLFDHARATLVALAAVRSVEPALATWSMDELDRRHRVVLEAWHQEVLAGRATIDHARVSRFAELVRAAGGHDSDERATALATAYRATSRRRGSRSRARRNSSRRSSRRTCSSAS